MTSEGRPVGALGSAPSTHQKQRDRGLDRSLGTTRASLAADAGEARAGDGHVDKERSSSPPTQAVTRVINHARTEAVCGEDYSLVLTLRGFKREALTVIKNQLPRPRRPLFGYAERGERALKFSAIEQALLEA